MYDRPAISGSRASAPLHLAGLLLLIFTLSSCSDSGRSQQQTKIAASHSESAGLALDSWLSGTVPDHYARRMSQTMRQKLADTLKIMEKAASPDNVQAATTSIRQAVDALARAETATAGSDRAAVARSREGLTAAARELRGAQAAKPSS